MTLLEKAKGVLAELPASASPGDIAEALTTIGSVYRLKFVSGLGDLAADERLPLLADRWGVGASKARDVRRLVEKRPGCLIGIRRRGASVVVDPVHRSVRAAREINRAEWGRK